jgi:hypothetical protein
MNNKDFSFQLGCLIYDKQMYSYFKSECDEEEKHNKQASAEYFEELKDYFKNFTFKKLKNLVKMETFAYLFVTYCSWAERRIREDKTMASQPEVYLEACNSILSLS